MSRGFRKQSFGARETLKASGSDGDKYDFPKPVVDQKEVEKFKVYEKAARMVFEDKKVKEVLKDLIDKLGGHLAYEDRGKSISREKIKQLKLDAVNAFKKLPAEIQEVIKVPDSMIDSLYRGVGDRFIGEEKGWKNGSFVYGFSDNKKVANAFVKKGGKLVTSKDIESFGGIISVERLYELASKHNQIAWGDDSKFMLKYGIPVPSALNGYSEADAKKKMDAFKKDYIDADNPFPGEREFIVYDIKFKKKGDDFYQ